MSADKKITEPKGDVIDEPEEHLARTFAVTLTSRQINNGS